MSEKELECAGSVVSPVPFDNVLRVVIDTKSGGGAKEVHVAFEHMNVGAAQFIKKIAKLRCASKDADRLA